MSRLAKKKCFKGVAVRRHIRGLSLVELMVALVLGLLILSGLVTVFVNSSAARNEVERTSRQVENGRYAIEVLSDDLRLAGYYGELIPSSAKDSLNPIAAPAALPDPCQIPASVTDWTAPLYVHVQGYRAPDLSTVPPDFATTSCTTNSIVTNVKPGSDIVVVRRVRACARPDPATGLPAPPEGCPSPAAGTVDTPYLQVSLCNTETPVTTHKVGLHGTVAFDRHQYDCTTDAILRQYYTNIYYISTVNGAGQSVPSLMRIEFTGTGWSNPMPLVEGIEHLKIEYGIDNNSDGLPDVYSADPGSVANWMNVMTAHFFVLARNIEPSPGYTDSKTYQLGTAAVPAPNDNYRRHVYASLVRIFNPSGRRETP